MMDEKIRIGLKAVELIRPGESVFIDGGSTTLQIAKNINSNMGVTVITNALNIAQELQNKHVPIIVIGGFLRESTSSMVGSIAMETVSRMAFDRAFLGASGLTVEHGFSNTNMDEAELKRLTIKQSKGVVHRHGP
jgi:DeoR family fructose operon transcriptional repressor